MEHERIDLLNTDNCGLAWNFQVNPVSCGNNTHYENYIKLCAMSDKNCGVGTTHVLVGSEAGLDVIIGFVTLRASSYIIVQDEVMYGEPAIEIMELAVDIRHEKHGYGTKLLDYVVATVDELNEMSLGAKYIVLCADSEAVPFYTRYGFSKVSDFGDVPRNGANDNCVPMILKLRT